MDAGGVLGRLIDPLLRGELAHESGVAVAARAGRDDLRARRLAAVAPCRILRARFVLRSSDRRHGNRRSGTHARCGRRCEVR